MLILCDDSVGMPLKMIFENILVTSLYPDSWKLANVTPIFKKGDKQSTNNYRPISLLPICGNIFEKIIRATVITNKTFELIFSPFVIIFETLPNFNKNSKTFFHDSLKIIFSNILPQIGSNDTDL